MAFWLKLFGWVLLFLGILYVILVTLLFTVVGLANRASLGSLAILFPASFVIGILLSSGFLVAGAIMYVGGRSLDYMERGKEPKHTRRRPVRRSVRAQLALRQRALPTHREEPGTRIRFCRGCGEEIAWEDRHCRHCGAAQ